ncbi:MAG: DUF2141 domain-containing protein [Brumimicrobium sp.]|nr:DUF2141 domain-containing protein [Brumimicrobium sp.]
MRTLIFLSVIFILGSFKEETNTITIKVKGISEVKGTIMLAFYENSKDFMNTEKADLAKEIAVKSSEMTITFSGLKNGKTYAFGIYHDKNNNRKLDTNFLGIPQEKYAFSKNAMGTFGPPDFDEASFVSKPNQQMEVSLH